MSRRIPSTWLDPRNFPNKTKAVLSYELREKWDVGKKSWLSYCCLQHTFVLFLLYPYSMCKTLLRHCCLCISFLVINLMIFRFPVFRESHFDFQRKLIQHGESHYGNTFQGISWKTWTLVRGRMHIFPDLLLSNPTNLKTDQWRTCQ
jgi:hypothetical protein